ncbi:hypothetical protein A0H81_10646 [Grifola frondosa]|uniref:Uncharacterized protein n=1 Tax=Grifola frondosa TaxID=5627 RepID=A0A1C7LXR4_GRIFR|nr:hypothetical protein A0H81_10646 [Grifola frondosa]
MLPLRPAARNAARPYPRTQNWLRLPQPPHGPCPQRECPAYYPVLWTARRLSYDMTMVTTHMMFGMLVPSHPPDMRPYPRAARIRRRAARSCNRANPRRSPTPSSGQAEPGLIRSMGSSVTEVVCDNDADDGVQVPDPPRGA